MLIVLYTKLLSSHPGIVAPIIVCISIIVESQTVQNPKFDLNSNEIVHIPCTCMYRITTSKLGFQVVHVYLWITLTAKSSKIN